MLPPLRLWVIVERKKLLSACQSIRPTPCQPPVWVTVNWVSTDQSSPSAGRSWPTKLTGPTEVVALAASSSKSLVGSDSLPSASVGAIGPLVGVPPLRVWRSQRSSTAEPSNSSERSYVHAPMTENSTLPISETLPASSVARNSTYWKPVSPNSFFSSAVSSSPSRAVAVHSSSASIVTVAGAL